MWWHVGESKLSRYLVRLVQGQRGSLGRGVSEESSELLGAEQRMHWLHHHLASLSTKENQTGTGDWKPALARRSSLWVSEELSLERLGH